MLQDAGKDPLPNEKSPDGSRRHFCLDPVFRQQVVEFVRARSFHGRGAGWIDIHLLASAIIDHIPLWTADPRVAALARDLGVAYELRLG